MALPEELAINGCTLRASPVCDFANNKVEFCADCASWPLPIPELQKKAADYLIEKEELDVFPIEITREGGKELCALCRQSPNAATNTVYTALAHFSFDVNEDMSGAINGSDHVIEAAVCDTCLKNTKKMHQTNRVFAVLAVILCLTINLGVSFLLPNKTSIVSVIALFLSIGLSYGVYRLLGNRMRRKIAKETIIEVQDVESIQHVLRKGWYHMKAERFKSDFTQKPKEFRDRRNMKRVNRTLKRLTNGR